MVPSPPNPAAYDQATLDFYAEHAPAYVANGKARVSRFLEDFMRALPPGAHVLELGCGSGRDAEALIAHGFAVDPTDGIPAMAALAEQRLGRPVRVLRFDALSAIRAYDAVWANASLLHVPMAALCDVLALIFRALKPGGLHFANYKVGGGAGRDSLGRYFNYPDRAALAEVYARSAQWDGVSMVGYLGGGYEGGAAPWTAVTARRPIE
ncbi:class I SAM-dependent methyltransferase [Sphingomonas hengshuiensis]|uniref:SAM-dependent methyltransferase n=1 Tax=Sphingomonas hengshuiensis TaxID=1609977 RepID=A0A7U4J9C5_9SPHN|nr:class I SAM-dependent methyltransferase [Sphingomonas hengshuiensis]AJP72648.1 SAM-dependent methyltransferase [Sphingomonas hengshuiensis]